MSRRPESPREPLAGPVERLRLLAADHPAVCAERRAQARHVAQGLAHSAPQRWLTTEGTLMDEVPTRTHVEAHAKAVVEGDMDTVANDFVPEMRDGIGEVAQKLPQPTTDADIEKLDLEDDHAVVQILYSNAEGSLAVRTRWEEHDGRPMIVEVLEVEERGQTVDAG